MHGRLRIELSGLDVALWFNNFSRLEIAKNLLPPKDGFDAKPQEVELIESIEKLANENHLVLMREIIWSGVVGYAYGTDTKNEFTRVKISELIATADQGNLAQVWSCFLESIGMNLDKDETKSTKKDDKKKVKS